MLCALDGGRPLLEDELPSAELGRDPRRWSTRCRPRPVRPRARPGRVRPPARPGGRGRRARARADGAQARRRAGGARRHRRHAHDRARADRGRHPARLRAGRDPPAHRPGPPQVEPDRPRDGRQGRQRGARDRRPGERLGSATRRPGSCCWSSAAVQRGPAVDGGRSSTGSAARRDRSARAPAARSTPRRRTSSAARCPSAPCSAAARSTRAARSTSGRPARWPAARDPRLRAGWLALEEGAAKAALALTASVRAPREVLVSGRLAAAPGLLDALGDGSRAWRRSAPRAGSRARRAARRCWPTASPVDATRRSSTGSGCARRAAACSTTCGCTARTDRARLAARSRPVVARATAARRASRRPRRGARRPRPSHARPQVAERPAALGHDIVAVDRLEVLLRRRDERPRPGASAKRPTTPAIIARTQSPAARGRRCARSTTAPSSLRLSSSKISLDIAPSTIVRSAATSNSTRGPRGTRGAACRTRAGCGWRRDLVEDAGEAAAGEAARGQPLVGVGRRRLWAWARSRCPGRTRRSRRVPRGGDRGGMERRDLLGRRAGHRRGAPLGEARRDGDLDARRGQALPDALGDLAHEPLRADRARVEDDLAHDLGHGGLEALRGPRTPRGARSSSRPGRRTAGRSAVDAEAHDGLDPVPGRPARRGRAWTDRRHVHVARPPACGRTPPRAPPGRYFVRSPPTAGHRADHGADLLRASRRPRRPRTRRRGPDGVDRGPGAGLPSIRQRSPKPTCQRSSSSTRYTPWRTPGMTPSSSSRAARSARPRRPCPRGSCGTARCRRSRPSSPSPSRRTWRAAVPRTARRRPAARAPGRRAPPVRRVAQVGAPRRRRGRRSSRGAPRRGAAEDHPGHERVPGGGAERRQVLRDCVVGDAEAAEELVSFSRRAVGELRHASASLVRSIPNVVPLELRDEAREEVRPLAVGQDLPGRDLFLVNPSSCRGIEREIPRLPLSHARNRINQ